MLPSTRGTWNSGSAGSTPWPAPIRRGFPGSPRLDGALGRLDALPRQPGEAALWRIEERAIPARSAAETLAKHAALRDPGLIDRAGELRQMPPVARIEPEPRLLPDFRGLVGGKDSQTDPA